MSEQYKIHKIVTCEVKEISPRVLEFIGSTEALDRQGDKVMASGWNLKNYMKNPVFQWAHDYSAPPIGRAVKVWVEGKKLMFHIEFADRDTYEFADTIYRLYKGGFLKATSVGFVPLNWEGKSGEDDMPSYSGNVFTEQELLELSGCPVPANPEALATAKSKRVINAREYKQMKSLWEEIQNAEIVDTTGDTTLAVNKPEETDEYIRIPVAAEVGKHEKHDIKTIDISKDKGIKALYCVDDTVNITYLFKREKWTMDDAKEWVEEHSKTAKEVSQEEIADEIDYLFDMIGKAGLNPENVKRFMDCIKESNVPFGYSEPITEPAMRLSGSDIPVEITDWEQKVKGYIKEAIEALKPKETPQPTQDEIAEAVKEAIWEIAKA